MSYPKEKKPEGCKRKKFIYWEFENHTILSYSSLPLLGSN